MILKNTNIAIGSFIVGALALLFFLLIFFSGGNYFTEKERVMMYFDGSVQGLQVGAPVKLKGVEIGEVINIEVVFLNDDRSIVNVVTADIVLKRIQQPDTQVSGSIFDVVIEKGLRAQLNYQSFLTGLLYVELDFYPDTEIRLLDLQSQYREIPTIKTDFESLFSEIQDVDLRAVSANLNSVLSSLNKLLQSGQIDTALNDFSAAARSLDKVASDISALVNAVDSELETLLARSAEQVPVISREFVLSLGELRKTLEGINSAVASAGDTFSEDSIVVEQISDAATEVGRAARALRDLSETLEQQPEALVRGKQKK